MTQYSRGSRYKSRSRGVLDTRMRGYDELWELDSAAWPPANLKRQPHIILRQRCRRGLRADEVIQLGQLNPRAEFALVGEFVQHRGHPPGEAHRLPDPRQRFRRIAIDARGRLLVVIFAQR